MSRNGWGGTLNDLRQELTSIQNKAKMVSIRFEELHKEAESFKITVLIHQLEERRESLVRSIHSCRDNDQRQIDCPERWTFRLRWCS